MNKKIFISAGILLLTIILISNIFAFAVSSTYHKDHPLEMVSGTSTNIQLVLQNMAGSEDIIAKGTILDGSDMARITDINDTYSIPFGTKKEVNIEVDSPKDAKIGKIYNLTVSFTTMSNTPGTLGFGSGVEQKIPVVIVSGPKPQFVQTIEKNQTIIWIVGLIILIIIVLIIIKVVRSKTKKRR